MNSALRIASRSKIRRQLLPSSKSITSRSSWQQRHRYLSSQESSSSLAAQNNDNLPSRLIDFSISSKIEGEESQVAIVELRKGETLRAESGAMLFMTQGVEMNTDLQGVSSSFSRMMTGQNVFLTDFTYDGDGVGTIGLGTDFPSKILRLSLEDYDGSTLICQRGAYMASNPSVDISMEATKSLSAGFFGGQGFILQRLTGQGDVLVKAGGTLVEKELTEGESLRVTSGSIVAFTGNVDYDIQMLPGVKNVMFGGEGLFVTKLTGLGPGAKVWLQGMPADRMIAEIARRVPSGGPGIGIPIGVGGGGGGGGEGAGDAAEGGVGGEDGGEAGEEMVAATDQAVDADRQATVASSGMAGDSSSVDPDSPSALFGDAAPNVDDTATFASTTSSDTAGDGGDMFKEETTFSDTDDTMFSSEDTTSFSDETTFSDDADFQTDQQQDSFWGSDGSGGDDQTTTDVFDSGSSEDAAEAGGGILSTLWDIFTGDD